MKTLLFIVSFLFALNVYSQIGGISASKLATPSSETVAVSSIEFEPSFSFASATNSFDYSGSRQALFSSEDSTLLFSTTGIRFTYGLAKNLEIGISLPSDVSTVSFGLKYRLPLDGKLTFALISGYNTIIGNGIYVKRNATHESTSTVAGGLILSYKFTDKFSCDFNAQYIKHLHTTTEGHSKGTYISSDFGYYLIENVDFIIGLNYYYKDNIIPNNNSHLLTLNPGIAIEKAKNFILVLNSPIDLSGKNDYQSYGFGLALTILLD